MWLAHSANPQGTRHDLAEHLLATALLARRFGESFGSAELAYWIGEWHDLGKVPPELQGDRLVYRVADTGIGIAQDKLETLFTEFRQGDPTITREFGGTGLGLSITRKFVELHGGRLWVDSELGKGSLFAFAIPLRLPGGPPA